MGERVCAVVVTRPGFSFDVDEARAHFAAAGAARQKTPEAIVLMDELPRTPSGKVRKDVLRAVTAAGAGGSGR
jgi:non-ribosomal peptide synthetase component E (peptide arylation enzyme)